MKYIIIGMVLLLLWIFLVPDSGMDPVLFDATRIDSVQIGKGSRMVTIRNSADKLLIATQLRQSLPANGIDRKFNRGIFYMSVFTLRKTYQLEVINTLDNGSIISEGWSEYKNDALTAFVENQFR